jgi:hypothetical protein
MARSDAMRLGWGFLTCIGDLKPITLGQRVLSEVSSDCRFVHLSFYDWSNRRCEGFGDSQGAEHS